MIVVAMALLGIFLLKYKEFKHRAAFFVILLVALFLVVSSISIFRNHDVDLGSFKGIVGLGKLYINSFVNILKNLGSITTNAVKQEWDVSTVDSNLSLR